MFLGAAVPAAHLARIVARRFSGVAESPDVKVRAHQRAEHLRIPGISGLEAGAEGDAVPHAGYFGGDGLCRGAQGKGRGQGSEEKMKVHGMVE